MADFLWVVPLDGARVTLEHCLELMPLLEGLWKVRTAVCTCETNLTTTFNFLWVHEEDLIKTADLYLDYRPKILKKCLRSLMADRRFVDIELRLTFVAIFS